MLLLISFTDMMTAEQFNQINCNFLKLHQESIIEKRVSNCHMAHQK